MSDFLYNQHMANHALGMANMRQQAADLDAARAARLALPVPGYPSPEILARSLPPRDMLSYPDPRLDIDRAMRFSMRLDEKYVAPLPKNSTARKCAKELNDEYFNGTITGEQLEKYLTTLHENHLTYDDSMSVGLIRKLIGRDLWLIDIVTRLKKAGELQ